MNSRTMLLIFRFPTWMHHVSYSDLISSWNWWFLSWFQHWPPWNLLDLALSGRNMLCSWFILTANWSIFSYHISRDLLLYSLLSLQLSGSPSCKKLVQTGFFIMTDKIIVVTCCRLFNFHMSGIKLIRSKLNHLVISLPFYLLLSLPQILKAFQKLSSILLTVKLLFRNTVFKAFMINKMATAQSSEEKHACTTTLEATYVCRIKIHFFERIYFFSYVSRYIRIGRSNIVY